jgi:transcriptional regulator with XRE-family HTH domain
MENVKQYHGWLALPRHAKMLRQDLGFHLFNLYIALVMEARWHRDNLQIGCVIGTQAEIASRLGVSQSTVSRGVDALYRKNKYYAVLHKRYTLLGFFSLFLADVAERMAKTDYANLNELYADMHRINAELQGKYAISQEKRDQKRLQRLYSSSKDNLSLSEEEVE